MASYVAAAGSNFRDEDAAVLGPALSALSRDNPTATNETILEMARAADSPFHPYVFKYDDREAAERHRLDLVRRMVRSILVEYESGGRTKTMRAFEYIDIVSAPRADAAPAGAVPSTRPSGPTYGSRQSLRRVVTAEFVIEHADATAEVIANAEVQLRAFQDKYNGYMDRSPEFRNRFRKVWAEIQALFAETPPRPRRGRTRPARTS